MEIRKFVIQIVSKFDRRGFDDAQRAAERLKGDAASAASSVDDLGSSTESANRRLKSFSATGKQTSTRFSRMRDRAMSFVKAMVGVSTQTKSTTTRLDRFRAGAKRTAASMREFGGRAKTVALALGGIVASAGLAIAPVLKTGAEFEKLRAQLDNLLGSAAAGGEAFGAIRQFTAETPFQLDEVTSAFIKLQGRGIQPTRERLTSLGDIASASGKTFDDIVEAALDATQGEGERLKEFGIRMQAAGDNVRLSFRGQTVEVAKSQEAITNALVAFGQMQGVAGSMSAQMDTLGGMFSNLKDRVATFLNTIANLGVIDEVKASMAAFGAVLSDDIAAVIADVIVGALQSLRSLFELVQGSGTGVAGVFGSIVEVGKLLFNAAKVILAAFFPFLVFWKQLIPVLKLGVEILGLVAKVVNDLFEAITNLVQGALATVTAPLRGFVDTLSEIVGLQGPLAAGFDSMTERLPTISSLFTSMKNAVFGVADGVASLNQELSFTGKAVDDAIAAIKKLPSSTLTSILQTGSGTARAAAEEELKRRAAAGLQQEQAEDAAKEVQRQREQAAKKREQALGQFEGANIRDRSAASLEALQRDQTIPDALKKRARAELKRRENKKKKDAAKGPDFFAFEQKAAAEAKTRGEDFAEQELQRLVAEGVAGKEAIAQAREAGRQRAKDLKQQFIDAGRIFEEDSNNILDILGLRGPGSVLEGRPPPQTLLITIAPVFKLIENFTQTIESVAGATALSEVTGEGGRAAVEAGLVPNMKMLEEFFNSMLKLQTDRLLKAEGGGALPAGAEG